MPSLFCLSINSDTQSERGHILDLVDTHVLEAEKK